MFGLNPFNIITAIWLATNQLHYDIFKIITADLASLFLDRLRSLKGSVLHFCGLFGLFTKQNYFILPFLLKLYMPKCWQFQDLSTGVFRLTRLNSSIKLNRHGKPCHQSFLDSNSICRALLDIFLAICSEPIIGLQSKY